MRIHIDMFSVFRRTVSASGWADNQVQGIMHNDCLLNFEIFPSIREDLPAHFGQGSERWGFEIVAILPEVNLDHSGLAICFENGERVDFAGIRFKSPEDDAYHKMMVRFADATKRGGRALEIGSRARSGNTYRSLFHSSIEYTGLDIAMGENVDVVGDAHHLSRFVSGKFDFVLSISVFEHLIMPWMVALEMNNIMNVGSLAFIQSHPSWPLHEEPWDFWRFSKDAWKGLFNAHTGFHVIESGYAIGGRITSNFAAGGPVQNLDEHKTYLLSGCLVEKVCESRVSWKAEASEIYNLTYSHA